jgi:hypothetical protein
MEDGPNAQEKVKCEATGRDSRTAIDFIDPLFAVVLNVSFAQIYLEPWFRDFNKIFTEPYFFYCSTLALGYLTVILSWVGYHRSIRTKWIDVETHPGRRRFFFDILLLIAYFVLLVSYDNFRRELLVLAVINLFFVIWDYYKQQEWPEAKEPDRDKRLNSAARRGISVFWLIVFSSLAAAYFFCPPTVRFCTEDWVILALAILFTIFYRLHKDHPVGKWLMMRLCYPRHHG